MLERERGRERERVTCQRIQLAQRQVNVALTWMSSVKMCVHVKVYLSTRRGRAEQCKHEQIYSHTARTQISVSVACKICMHRYYLVRGGTVVLIEMLIDITLDGKKSEKVLKQIFNIKG